VYAQTCAGCHSPDGSGMGINNKIPNMSDEQIIDIIENGTGGMGPQNVRGDCTMLDLIAFLRDAFG